MTDRENLKYILFKLKSERSVLFVRWGKDLPEIPKAEMEKLDSAISYIQHKIMLLNQREYGYEHQDGYR